MFYIDVHCDKACFRACYSEAAFATSDSFRKIGSHIVEQSQIIVGLIPYLGRNINYTVTYVGNVNSDHQLDRGAMRAYICEVVY